MPRCAETKCGRWRPDLTALERVAGAVRRLGALQFNGQWYCSRSCVEQAARANLADATPRSRSSSPLPPLKVGVLLRHAGAITQEQLETGLAASRQSGLKIGEQLQRLGYATSEQVLRALAAQEGVSYLATFDVARVSKVEISIPEPMVRALGLVPFEADEKTRRVSVVCAAPVPKAAIRALIRLTGWAADVYLVADRVFYAALEAYRPGSSTPHAHDAMAVESVTTAASHIANLAVHERAITMQHAMCNDYRWVRVRGPERVSDLFVMSGVGESSCSHF